ncbi:MAG: archease [Candidatus Pacearchaeota archaeon]
MGYTFLPHTADVLFEVKAKKLDKLFVDAAKALNAAQVELKTLKAKEKKEIIVEGNNIEELLYNFLQELVFVKDVEQMLFKRFDIKIEKKIEEKNGKYRLVAMCYGDKIQIGKQELLADVKAVTMEEFRVWQERGSWRARVLVDV